MSSQKRRWPETPAGVEVFELREAVELLSAANETLVNANRELAESNTAMARKILGDRLRAVQAGAEGEVTPDLVRLLRSRFAMPDTDWHGIGAIVLADGTAVFRDVAAMAVIPAHLGPHDGVVCKEGSTKYRHKIIADYLAKSNDWQIEQVDMPTVGLMPGGILPAPLGGNARFEFIDPCVYCHGEERDEFFSCWECGSNDSWAIRSPYDWPVRVGRRFYQMHYLLRIADLPGLAVWEPVVEATQKNGRPIPLCWKARDVHGFIMPLAGWEVGKQ